MSESRRGATLEKRDDLRQNVADRGSGDPYGAAWLTLQHNSQNRPTPEYGVIVDVVPGLYCYKVHASIAGALWCSPSGGGVGAFGTSGGRTLTTYPTGAAVWFLRDPGTPSYGTILYAEPHWTVHAANHPADQIWPFVRTGQVEAAHQQPVTMSAAPAAALGGAAAFAGGVDVIDFAAGRPLDASAVGEWGVMMETGVAAFADPFQAYLRVDEATGLFLFYPDQMARLSGHNLQIFSTVRETEHLDDEGELAGWSRGCVYPWEAYGLWRWDQVTPGWNDEPADNHGEAAGQGVTLNDPMEVLAGSGAAVREPEDPTQIPAARVLEFEGYLGQGGSRSVTLPVQLDWAYSAQAADIGNATVSLADPGDDDPNGRVLIDDDSGPDEASTIPVPAAQRGGPARPGVLEEHRTLTGGYSLRTARRILICKRISIPSPGPALRPEDPAGDNPRGVDGSEYAPSGLADGAAVHYVDGDATPTDGGTGRTACLLPDILAYCYNWENLHPFAYHERDWDVPEEGAAGADLANQDIPNFAALAVQQFLDRPTAITLNVDHRYGDVDYYPNEAGFAVLDDGTVVLFGGWGEEIRLSGGNIELRCPGDINLFAGKDVQAWGGRDAVVKAHRDLDLSTAHGDVRIKAESSFQALAGNDDCGGFLFESKARCAAFDFGSDDTPKTGTDAVVSGFVVRCPTSQVQITADDVVLGLDPDAADGRIILDAGTRPVEIRGSDVIALANGSVLFLFPGSTPAAYEFCGDHALLGNNLYVYGDATTSGSVYSDGWLVAAENVAAGQAEDANNQVIVANDIDSVDEAATVLADRHSYLVDTYLGEFDDEVVLAPESDRAEFTYRDDDRYGTAAYTVWASRWQDMADRDGQDLPTWSEPLVVGTVSGAQGLPFPGLRAQDDGSYLSQPLRFVGDGGVAIDRTANQTDYEDGSYRDPDSFTLELSYTIVVDA